MMQEITSAVKRCPTPGEDKTKRLTVDVSEPIHKALKLKAVTEGVTMTEIVRRLLMDQIVPNGG